MRLLQINTFSLIIYFQEDTKTEIYKTKSEPLALQPSEQATLLIPLFNLHIKSDPSPALYINTSVATSV